MPAPGRSKTVKETTVVILDMAAVIHIIKPQRARIFGEYTQMQLLPYMQSHMTENTSRVDAIWDTYQEASLKSQTRAKRGETSSRRTRVSPRYLSPRESNGRSSSKITKIKMSYSNSSVRNFRGAQLNQYTTSSQRRLTLYSVTKQLT